MLRLREIMSTDIVTVGPETAIREAMELFAHRHISGAPVVTGSTLVGVVTSTDLMAFAASLPGVPRERDTRDHHDEQDEAPVDDESGQVAEVGSAFVSEMWDDARAHVTERMSQPDAPEWNVLEEHDASGDRPQRRGRSARGVTTCLYPIAECSVCAECGTAFSRQSAATAVREKAAGVVIFPEGTSPSSPKP